MKNPPRNFAHPMTFLTPSLRPVVSCILALFLCGGAVSLSAQSDPDAEALLAKVSAAMKGYATVHAEYQSTMIDRQSDFEMEQAGEVWVEGDRYHLRLGQYTIISDGLTVWTYEPEMGECYIDDAEAIAEDGIDPAKMFTIWEEGFKKVYKGGADLDGQTVTRIDLHPEGSEDKGFHTIQCFIDEASLEVVQLVVKGREGTDVVYRIAEFEGNGAIPEGAFTFDVTQYPGTTVIDNRL